MCRRYEACVGTLFLSFLPTFDHVQRIGIEPECRTARPSSDTGDRVEARSRYGRPWPLQSSGCRKIPLRTL